MQHTTLPPITDPTEVRMPKSKLFMAFCERCLRDMKDVPFALLIAKILGSVVLLGILLYMPFIKGWLWWVVAAVYFYISNFVYKAPFGLMTHCVSHRPLFKRECGWMRHIMPWLIGPFFGQSPGTYYSHHVGMHHPENNLEDDDSTTILFQRDSFGDFLLYVAKFVFIGFYNLTRYFNIRKRHKLRNKVMIGELGLFAFWAVMCLVNWQATVVVFILPFVISRIIMMLGNWAQHAFVDYDDPANFFKNSVTCINTPYNHKCFNDGYHTSHHLRPNLHWTEYPDHLKNHLSEFRKHRALIFNGISYVHIWWNLMTRNYDRLASHIVNLDGMFATHAEVVAYLKSRTQKMPRRGITSESLRMRGAARA